MFTKLHRRFAATAAAGLLCTSLASAQDVPLPRPPLQPLPKEFQVPRPKLGVPDAIPVAQESEPRRSFRENPLPPERRYTTPPDIKHDTPLTLPQPPSVIGGQTANGETAGETRVTGKVVRVDKDRVAIETNGGAAMALYVDPQTRYLRRSYDALIPGASFAAT